MVLLWSSLHNCLPANILPQLSSDCCVPTGGLPVSHMHVAASHVVLVARSHICLLVTHHVAAVACTQVAVVVLLVVVVVVLLLAAEGQLVMELLLPALVAVVDLAAGLDSHRQQYMLMLMLLLGAHVSLQLLLVVVVVAGVRLVQQHRTCYLSLKMTTILWR